MRHEFKFRKLPDEQILILLRYANLVRKLSFIERLFSVKFELPDDITADQVRRAETVFYGVTDGEFICRNKDIRLPVRSKDIDLSLAPFSANGSYTQLLGYKEIVLGQWLDVGPFYVTLKNAIVANKFALTQLREGRDSDVRFEVLNNQLIFRFETYARLEAHKDIETKLRQFYSQLRREEPSELAHTLMESLTSDVSSAEALEIATGWKDYSGLPDRFCPQDPIFDEEHGRWRVPIFLVYANGQGGPVGELLIDLKTGSVIAEPSAEEMQQKGLALAEKILRAG